MAAITGSPAGFTLMSLRPFVFLTACLLGACERKSVSTGAALPDHAETRSSLRDEERRPVVTGREREGKVDVVELIRRMASDGNWLDAEEAIKAADPSEFEAIWKALAELEVNWESSFMNVPESRHLQLLAIYHLAAKRDLAAAGRLTREILLPLCAGEERLPMLKGLMDVFASDEAPEKLASFAEFMRDASTGERAEFEKRGGYGGISPAQLSHLIGSDQRLNGGETRMIINSLVTSDMREMAHVSPTEPSLKELCLNFWEIVKAGERKGVFPKGAGDMYLNVAGIFQGDWYLEVVPLEKLDSMLRMEGGKEVVEGLIGKDIGRTFFKGEHLIKEGALDLEGLAKTAPETFFTSSGIRYLPEERYADALLAWHKFNNETAEAWFASASELTASQRDLIRAGLAKSEGRWNAEKSRPWLDQISDPELRERTVKEIEARE